MQDLVLFGTLLVSSFYTFSFISVNNSITNLLNGYFLFLYWLLFDYFFYFAYNPVFYVLIIIMWFCVEYWYNPMYSLLTLFMVLYVFAGRIKPIRRSENEGYYWSLPTARHPLWCLDLCGTSDLLCWTEGHYWRWAEEEGKDLWRFHIDTSTILCDSTLKALRITSMLWDHSTTFIW